MNFTCPHCNNELKAHEEHMGTIVECPYCEGSIQMPNPPVAKIEYPQKKQIKIDTAKFKERSLQSRGAKVEVTNIKQGALIGAIVCFIIGLSVQLFSGFLIFLYAPIYFAAFVLAITAMSQRKILGGMTILLLSLIIPFMVSMVKVGKLATKIEEAKNTPPQDQSYINWKWMRFNQPLSIGEDLKLTLVGASIAKPIIIDGFDGGKNFGEKEVLILKIKCSNITSNKKIEYNTWRGQGFSIRKDTATLEDNNGNRYRLISYGSMDYPLGAIRFSESIYPGKDIEDILIFELPVNNCEHLFLTLPAKNIGAKEDIHLKLEMKNKT